MFEIILVISAVIVFFFLIRSHHFFKSLFLSAFQGIIALFAVNFIGDIIGIHLMINWYSLGVSMIGGLPGVIFLLVNDIVAKL